MNATTGGITKKRKKSDAKPQSQINKCLNEKRRRFQENEFIEELAVLISSTDMSSGKTDKCQILQRTVDQIQHLQRQEGNNSHAVQQGEVSSSNPNILSNDQVGPILLEALDGFLFVVNTEGRVEFVTDNIQQYINYTKEDVLGKDIYNIIHHGDHQAFMPSLMPMSIGWTSEPQVQSRNRTFNCRFLVKPPDDQEESIEEKQQRISKYESMQICSAILPNTNDHLDNNDVTSESSDIGPCVMCVARRISYVEKPSNAASIQQFTLKLDTTGRIINVDTSWLSSSYTQYIKKEELIGTNVQDLCHPNDLSKFTVHLKNTLQRGEGETSMYQLRVGPETFVNVQTKSKIFGANPSNINETDFIMSTYSIIGDNDLTPNEGGQLSNSKVCSGHSSNHCANNSSNNNGNNNNNVGGPLMSVAHVNGQVSGMSARTTNNQSVPFGTTTTTTATTTTTTTSDSCNPLGPATASNPFNHFSNVDLELEFFPNSSWELDSSSGCADNIRPESRNTGPSNSRPPSQPAPSSSPQAAFTSNSTVTSHCSPLRAYSPTTMIGVHSFSNSFPFSPLQDSPTSLLSVPGVTANGGNASTSASTSAGPVSGASIGKDVRGCSTPSSHGIESIGSTATTSSSIGGASTSSTLSPTGSTTITSMTSVTGTSPGSSASTTIMSSLTGTMSVTQSIPSTTTASSSNAATPISMSASNISVNTPTNLMASAESQSSLSSSGDSGRLRNLLTRNHVSNDDTQDSSNNDSENQNEHRILKILLNQQDEDDYHSEHSAKVRSNTGIAPKPAAEHSKSLGNNMLLQLLNEKNDEDDETRAGSKKQNELLQQLLKESDDERKMQQEQKSRDDDSLLRSLGFKSSAPSSSQSNDHGHGSTSQAGGQKRPCEDGDLNMSVKRSMDNSHQVSSSGSSRSTNHATSKLWEKNKMLASLLAKEPSQPTTIPPIPASVISATPQDKLPRVADRLKQQQQQQPWTGSGMQSVGSTATTTVATSARTPLQNQSRQLPRQAANIYLNHMLSHERPQMSPMDTEFTGGGGGGGSGGGGGNGGDFRTPISESNPWDNQSSDPALSEILDQVMEFVPDEVMVDPSTMANLLLDSVEPPNDPMKEKMAINAIQKSLMLCESAVNPTSSTITMPSTPPAYSSALGSGTSVTTAHNYQPPPMYQQQQQTRARFTGQAGIRQPATQFTPQQQQQQQLQLQHRQKLIQQHQHQHQQRQEQQRHEQQLKNRLLQQQQQQQVVIPSNATAPDQIPGIQNIDNLLNNAVAPNVSLQRTGVSDSQMSPGYGGSVQLSNTHRISHSYSHPSTINQHAVNNNFNSGQPISAASRLSPHSPATMMTFAHHQSLSPRVSQGNYGNNQRMFNVNSVRPQQQQQQQQPNATQQLQQQRSMPSPGTAVPARQSPFPAEVFPPPASPTASQFPPAQNPGNTNPTTQYRLQRASSTPTTTTQLPGGVVSPRHYGSVNKDQQSLMSPGHQRAGCPPPPTPTHNHQHSMTNNQQQHYTNQQQQQQQQQQQHNAMLYRNTGNSIVNNPDVQNNQFCYDQGTVPGYPTRPEDTRSMSSSNPGGHQMGGNTAGLGSTRSEFVRQELRAVVGARTQQRVPNNIQSNVIEHSNVMEHAHNNVIGQVSQDDLDVLGLSAYETSTCDYY
ncbi:nuclear receptor coactivator 3 isoform X2 [Microplitis demolitor]|uniref:nuclear receptor coactivator 3 isoform X2 n=1 Tax=Microplitis demolitor TaxID=69319 RepID=UPI0004CC99A5|nr:nuclear receptor coactivator 3 isoform X2 [Microplitis demolitor]